MTKAVFRTTGGSGSGGSRKGYVATFSAGDKIFAEGDLGTEMFIIQEGEVNIVKHLGREHKILTSLEKGDFFGEMAVMEDAPRTADAIAQTNVTLLAINGSRFDQMIRKNPEIAIRIIRKYSRRLREANKLLETLVGVAVDPEQPSIEPATQERIAQRRLVDVATGKAFHFAKGSETTIGRSDPVTGIQPDIDLTTVDSERSVSRRHAKILHREDGSFAMFEEVGTVNGTYVNDEKIQTGVPAPIGSGDRVRIGLVQMKVVYEE